MKTITTIQLAAAGILSLSSVALGQSLCAVNCFQSVITEHPPLDCTEDNMYLCFCTIPELQGYFSDCAYEQCADESEATVEFGVTLCADLGVPISIPPRPEPTTSTAMTETMPAAETTSNAVTSETSAAEPTTSEDSSEISSTGIASSEPSAAVSSTFTTSGISFTPVPLPTTNSTLPPQTTPTQVAPNMGNTLGVTSGLLFTSGLLIAALQFL